MGGKEALMGLSFKNLPLKVNTHIHGMTIEKHSCGLFKLELTDVRPSVGTWYVIQTMD